MDLSKLSISKPVLIDNEYVPKHYLQFLRFQSGPLKFQSTLFYSNGPKLGLNKNYRLCITLTPKVREELTAVEKFVCDNLELPPPIAEKWQQYSSTTGDKQPLKGLHEGMSLYMKVANQVSLFNLDNVIGNKYQPFENPPPPLGAGWYIVKFSVPAVYIGSHNANPKVASIQTKIEEIVYRPYLSTECSIEPVDESALAATSSMEVTVEDDQPLNSFIDKLFEEEKVPEKQPTRKRNRKGELKKTAKVDTVQDVIDTVVQS